MRKLTYTSAAKEDLARTALYIAQQSGSRDIAIAFTNQLREKCRRLASLPGTLGSARPELRPDIRSMPAYGYVIFFRYRDGMVEIVNILHGSRDVDGYFEL